jgi:hypothetical protein
MEERLTEYLDTAIRNWREQKEKATNKEELLIAILMFSIS